MAIHCHSKMYTSEATLTGWLYYVEPLLHGMELFVKMSKPSLRCTKTSLRVTKQSDLRITYTLNVVAQIASFFVIAMHEDVFARNEAICTSNYRHFECCSTDASFFVIAIHENVIASNEAI